MDEDLYHQLQALQSSWRKVASTHNLQVFHSIRRLICSVVAPQAWSRQVCQTVQGSGQRPTHTRSNPFCAGLAAP